MSTANSIRHDLINSAVIIKRLTKSIKPMIEKLIMEHSDQQSSSALTDQQLAALSQSIEILEKETETLSKICDSI